MIWVENFYLRLFEARRNERGYFQGKGSTSEKVEKKGEEPTWRRSSWNVRATRNTEDNLISLMDSSGRAEKGVTIYVTKGKVDNVIYQDKQGNYKSVPTITIIGFDEVAGKGEHKTDKGSASTEPMKTKKVNSAPSELEEEEEELPF